MKIIEKLNTSLFKKNDTIVIGLSGGADSVALTHMLLSIKPLELNVVSCHVNHGLRGQESDSDSKFAEDFCKKLKIPLYIKVADVKTLSLSCGLSVEECGRDLRYSFFEEIACKLDKETDGENSVHIVTAHNLSDNVETVLFNLTRGTALKGLCGIPESRKGSSAHQIIRPLLEITRAEVEQYCEENALLYVTDSTNLLDIYARNNIRHRVIPVLKEINPSLEHKVSETIEVLSLEQDFLEQLAQERYSAAVTPDGLEIEKIAKEHIAILRRIIVIFLENHKFPVSNKNVDILVKIVLAGKGQHNILKNKFIVARKNLLFAFENVEDNSKASSGKLPKSGILESKTGKTYKVQTLSMITSESFNKIYKNLFAISLDCGKICGSVISRERMPKDKIKLSANTSTKSLKNLFQERNIDKARRSKLFILSDDNGVVAIEEIGVSERVKCDAATKEMITLEQI